MTPYQKDMLNISYYLSEPSDLGLTVAAIGWQESQNGKYLVALDEGSIGVHHININTAIKRSKMRDTPLNRSFLATQIITDPKVSTKYALKELNYWSSAGKGWRDSVKSYNSGWNISHGTAREYLRLISEKVRKLKRCESEWKKPYMPENY